MAKRQLGISNLKRIPDDIAKQAANAMEGEKVENEVIEKEEREVVVKVVKTEKQKNRKTEIRPDNISYKTVRINKALHYKLKVKALEKEMKITDFIEALLEKGVK
jgi:exosome complex RNA-binding protein Csl4